MRLIARTLLALAALATTQTSLAAADRWHHRPHVLSEQEFSDTVLSALRSASTSEEARVCRFHASFTAVTSDQVSQVIRAIASRNEAACALAFFPRVVDPQNWEEVYRPMSSSAEREVREAVDRQLSSGY